jgi:biotin transport system substrate-specific component
VSTRAEAIAPARSRPRARVAYSAVLAIGGCCLIAGLAQLSIKLPFTPVPITGQTLGVLLVGASFGPMLGGLTLGLYLVEGWIGLPFYAQGQHGTAATLFHPSGLLPSAGYLWGFIAAALVVGWLSRREWDRSLRSSIGAMFLGEIVLYAIGIAWLAAAIGVPMFGSGGACNFSNGAGCDALQLGLYPFIIGDTLKLLLAAVALPTAWRLLGRPGSTRQP